MDPPSRPTTSVSAGGPGLVPPALNHASRPHAPQLLNRSQSKDSGHLSLSTEHARFTQHQVVVNRLNNELCEGTNHDAPGQHGPTQDDTCHSVSAADALALIQFSRSERHTTHSPVNREQQQHVATSLAGAGVVATNVHAQVTTVEEGGQLDASSSPLLSAATRIVEGGTSQQQSHPSRVPPGRHVFSSTRLDTMTELFGPPVLSSQPNEPGPPQNTMAAHSESLRSPLSMSVFDIRQSDLATNVESAAPRSPIAQPPAGDSESTCDNTAGLPALSLRPSGMSQYIDLSGMQNHQRRPPTTTRAATEYAERAVIHGATLVASAPMTPAATTTVPSFSSGATPGPGSPAPPSATGRGDVSVASQVEDCPSQAAMWTPRLGHRIPDPGTFGSARPQAGPPTHISKCATTRITTDCANDKPAPNKLVAPPLRKRTITNPTGYPREILEVLESHFAKCSHLCKERAEMIGQEAGGLEKFRVDNWFHNRRKNYKKRGYELKCDPDECVDVKLKPAKPPVKRKKSAASTRQSSLANMGTSVSAAPMGTSAGDSAHNGVGANASNPTMAPSLSAFFHSMMASSAPLSRFHLAAAGGTSAASMLAGQSSSSLAPRVQAQGNASSASSASAQTSHLQHPNSGLYSSSAAQAHSNLAHGQTHSGLQHHPMAGFPLTPPAFPLYSTNGQVTSLSTFPAWPLSSMGTPPMPRPPANSGLPSGQQPSPSAPPTPFMSPYYSMFNMAHLMHQSPQVAGSAAAPIPLQFPMTHSPFILVHPRPPAAAAGAATFIAAATTTVGPTSSSVPVSSLLSDAPASNAGRSLSIPSSSSTDGEASDGASDRVQRQEAATMSTASSMAAYMARTIEGSSGEQSGAASESHIPGAVSHAAKRKAEADVDDDSLSPNLAKRPK